MTMAGWYPDPDGKGGQRYFDGNNWGPAAPASTPTGEPSAAPSALATAPPKQTGSGGKVIGVIVALVFLLLLIGKCSGSSDDDENSASETSASRTTTSSVATASRTPTPTPTGPKKPDAAFSTPSGPDGAVTAVFAIGDNLTEGLIKTGARFDTIEILEYAKQTYPNASEVTVQGSFPMKDAYGNTSTDVVINVTYLRSTIDQINFEGVDKDKIWELSDSGFIAPAFRP